MAWFQDNYWHYHYVRALSFCSLMQSEGHTGPLFISECISYSIITAYNVSPHSSSPNHQFDDLDMCLYTVVTHYSLTSTHLLLGAGTLCLITSSWAKKKL